MLGPWVITGFGFSTTGAGAGLAVLPAALAGAAVLGLGFEVVVGLFTGVVFAAGVVPCAKTAATPIKVIALRENSFFILTCCFSVRKKYNYHTKTTTLPFVNRVRPKKHLGQHFLNSDAIAAGIAELVPDSCRSVIEIGPGMGILTAHLAQRFPQQVVCIEIDKESVEYLSKVPYAPNIRVIEGDFLHLPEETMLTGEGPHAVIGNFPYNISSQIVFRVLETQNRVDFFGGMFQREVAQRLCAGPGSKTYGILSVLLQTFYECSYCFTVQEGAFTPPPKVKSGVIACRRKPDFALPCRYENLKMLVKMAFNQRRKTLTNALKALNLPIPHELASKRAEALSFEDYLMLTALYERAKG
jgi:16S rRNA (adenine1518-N6/adenine1519-N6)-dimethyltransferase